VEKLKGKSSILITEKKKTSANLFPVLSIKLEIEKKSLFVEN
jgi:hypothetical protein